MTQQNNQQRSIELSQMCNMILKMNRKIDKATVRIFQLAEIAAEKERVYRIAKHQEILKLRDEGIQVTYGPDVAMGRVAQLKYERDLSRYTYLSAKDALKAMQSQLNAMQTVIRYQTDGEDIG